MKDLRTTPSSRPGIAVSVFHSSVCGPVGSWQALDEKCLIKTNYLVNQALLIYHSENTVHANLLHQNKVAVGQDVYYYANPKHYKETNERNV